MDAPITRLEDARDDLVRRWLARVVERAPLEEIARLPTDRIVTELPRLISQVLHAAERPSGSVAATESPAAEAAPRLAALRGRDTADPSELADDVALLQSVMTEALADTVTDPAARSVLAAVDRLSASLHSLLAAAVSDLVDARGRELESLANTDPLTGLFNVRFMRQHLAHLVGMQQRYGHPFALLVLDVDGLKRINDAFGHAAGDRALIGIATTLRETIRSIDTAVRIGGDEFCVLAPEQSAARAAILAERIAGAVRRVEAADGIALGVSVGVVGCPEHAVDADRLLELADEAMYRSKAAGGEVATVAGALADAPGENGVSSGA